MDVNPVLEVKDLTHYLCNSARRELSGFLDCLRVSFLLARTHQSAGLLALAVQRVHTRLLGFEIEMCYQFVNKMVSPSKS